MSEGFLRAQSDNFSLVASLMVADFFSKNELLTSAEQRGVKAKWWTLRFQMAVLTFSALKTCAGLHCDESAATERRRVSNVFFQLVTHNISVECTGVDLPISSIYTRHSCSSCPRVLKISSSNISVVPSAAFSNFPLITTLRLEKNHINNLLPGAFNALHSLREIYLGGNNITQLNTGIFNSLLNLEVIDLSKNNLKDLAANCLTGTNKLKSLNLSSNSLITFEDSVLNQNLVELEYIDLSFNQIAQVEIENIKYKINNIDLSWNKIRNVDFCFSEFKSINISRNELKSLKTNSCSNRTSRIINLDVSYNKISELLPDAFLNLSQLERLNLEYNNISSLPTELFFHLFNLIDLNLSNNDLEQFSHGTFESLEKLEFLDISYNKFTTIKRYLHSLVNLKELNIQRNKIFDFDSEQLVKDLPYLTKISMDGNNFTCDGLIDIIHYFKSKRINIAHGSARNTSNIHGIPCSDSSNLPAGFSENIASNFEKIILNKLGQLSDQDSKTSGMHEYFNDDFKSSNFYKYLEEMKEQKSLKFNDSEMYEFFNRDFQNSRFYKYLENFKNAENSTIEFNKSIYDYFGKDFKNSSFVKYLENLNNAGDILNGGFLNSEMYKYFNTGFQNSRFYKYLENLKVNWEPFNSSDYTRFDQHVEKTGDTKILSTVTAVVLVIIALSLIILTVRVCHNFNKKKMNQHEQVELIDA